MTLSKKIICIFVLICALLLTTGSFAGNFEVILEGDMLSLRADKTPLQDILRRISRQGISVKIDPQLNPPITSDFNNRDIKQALDSIIKPYSHGLIWKKTTRKGRSHIRLAEIEIFKPGGKALIRELTPPNTNLEIAKDPKTGALFVRNELLLKLAKGTTIEKLAGILQRFQAEIIDSNSELGIYRIRFSKDTDLTALRKQLESLKQIAEAAPNYAYPVGSPMRSPQGMMIGNRKTTITSIQNNAAIAILDSGIDSSAGLSQLTINSMDATQPDVPISDTLGHGTQMAYIASGVIKPFGVDKQQETQNSIIPIRVFDDNGYTSDFNVIQSLNFAQANGARIVNMSWGSETRSPTMEQAFLNAQNKGMILVASAGNEPTGQPVYPAAYDSVIAVGATTPHGDKWANSNYGSFVSLSAPGFATLPVGHKGEPGLYAGTSISSALVASTIATYLDKNPSATLEDIKKHLKTIYD